MKKAFNLSILLLIIVALISCSTQNPNPNSNGNNTTSLPSVTICNQVWSTKNLDVSTYRNGDAIPQVTDSAQWANLTTGAWCYYNNDPANGAIYGKLYNYYAVVDPRGLAPAGWHIPSHSEWKKLVKCVDPTSDTTIIGIISNNAGGPLKEVGTSNWKTPNTGATNTSNFSALGGGRRHSTPSVDFGYKTYQGNWWITDQYVFRLDNNNTDVYIYEYTFEPTTGVSVRCIKD